MAKTLLKSKLNERDRLRELLAAMGKHGSVGIRLEYVVDGPCATIIVTHSGGEEMEAAALVIGMSLLRDWQQPRVDAQNTVQRTADDESEQRALLEEEISVEATHVCATRESLDRLLTALRPRIDANHKLRITAAVQTSRTAAPAASKESGHDEGVAGPTPDEP